MNLSKTEAKKFLEKRLRALARKERISKHNVKAVKNIVLKEISFYQKIYGVYFYVQIKIISRGFF